MKNIVFLDSIENLEVDTLIVRHKRIQKELDQVLGGAVELNLERFSLPAIMTTNGQFPIPKLIFADDQFASLAKDNRVAFAVEGIEPEKLAFELLLNQPNVEDLYIVCQDPEAARIAFQYYQSLYESISMAKEIISAPANQMTPDEVAKRCLELENQGIDVTVLDEVDLKKVGADALLAVGKGSSQKPKMVLMEHRGSNDASIALVGKGICYDSGGINLKNSHLVEMKWDKAGAGAVIGVMAALSKLKLPVHVIGCIVLAENMPDGNALKPGDVISSLKGLSIEVVDTDCEGRLALADGMAYVQKMYAPKTLIDLGTLTLETFGALGGEYAGLFCNDSNLTNDLISAGQTSGEKLWPLPLGDYFAKQIRSQCADIKNVGVFRYGGSSAAAEFLHAFVEPGVAFAHLDIAGTAWRLDALEEGVTAFGVKLLIDYLNVCPQKS